MSTNFLADYISVGQAMVEYNISRSGVMKIVKNYNLELSKVGGQSFMKRTNFEEKMKAELNSVSEKRKVKIANKEKWLWAKLKHGF
jgi:NADH/NAD ratio-sensing transcriptional regulator Rex